MAHVTEDQILDSLKGIIDPASGKDIVSLGMVAGLVIKDGNVGFAIEVDPERGAELEPLRREAEQKVHALAGVLSVSVVLTAERKTPSQPPQGQATAQPAGGPAQAAKPSGGSGSEVPGVRSIVAIASGKGGVGKSTTATNLALAFAGLGLKVGILDADIYGPSIGLMLGVPEGRRPEIEDEKFFVPIMAHGIQAMSMSFLVTDQTPMVWRGPMASGALQQLLGQSLWADLDMLIVDMPPGTGDIQLTLAQKASVAGAVIVTTPQEIALQDARKGVEMFRKVDIPVLGVIENMSVHRCSECGHESHIFGDGGGQRIADQYATALLGALPLAVEVREQVDSGQPSVVAEPDGAIASEYRSAARHLAARLWQLAGSAATAPTISISDD